MRGAIAVSASVADFELLQGEQDLTLYQFNTHVAKHWFCGTCGIYTHHVRRSDPQMIGVNVACLNGMGPFDFPSVAVVDGVNHPTDSGGTSRVVGMLRFERLD